MNHLQLPIVITPSRAQLGTRCHRRHFLSDVLSKELFQATSLEFGSLLHAGAGAKWLGRDWRSVIAEEWYKRFELTTVSQDNVSLAMATKMMEYYEAEAQLAGPFQDAADDWKLVDVEQRFEVPIGDDIVLSLQADRVVYSKSQDWLVVGDLKSASRLDKRWERQWEMSLQMKLYKGGVKKAFAHEGRFDVFIEGLHKHVPSDIRYFACPEWSVRQIGEAIWNARHIANIDEEIVKACEIAPGVFDLAKAEEIGVVYTPTNDADCFAYNSECPFYRICTADTEERVGILRGEFNEKVEEDY